MRDDFTQQTLDILAKRVGVRCSNPGCRKMTTGPRSDTTKIINIGVGAHITAASSDGPRFDANLSSEERKSPDNGIWLCQNCAKLVDNDEYRYTVEVLKSWKQTAEKAALLEVEGGVVPPKGISENLVDIDISCRTLKQQSERHDYRLDINVRNLDNEAIRNYHIDLEFPAIVVDRSQTNRYFVQERSSNDISFFRAIYQAEDGVIYPGDTKIVLSVSYYMNNDIYKHRGNLFKQVVRAIFYRQEYHPLIVEKLFDELQNF